MKNKNNISKNKTLVILIKYGVFGVLWILFSDLILQLVSDDFSKYMELQTYKGWVFVLVTIVFMYVLIRKMELQVDSANYKSSKAIEDLENLAYYDPMTGLVNGSMFRDKIENLISNHECEFALVLLNIDNFYYINDTVGHSKGDEFLIWKKIYPLLNILYVLLMN